jgi:hypothetical protein
MEGVKKMSKDKIVEFQYSGNLSPEDRKIAFQIALDSDSADEAWEEVRKLDQASIESICDVGTFLEHDKED